MLHGIPEKNRHLSENPKTRKKGGEKRRPALPCEANLKAGVEQPNIRTLWGRQRNRIRVAEE